MHFKLIDNYQPNIKTFKGKIIRKLDADEDEKVVLIVQLLQYAILDNICC